MPLPHDRWRGQDFRVTNDRRPDDRGLLHHGQAKNWNLVPNCSCALAATRARAIEVTRALQSMEPEMAGNWSPCDSTNIDRDCNPRLERRVYGLRSARRDCGGGWILWRMSFSLTEQRRAHAIRLALARRKRRSQPRSSPARSSPSLRLGDWVRRRCLSSATLQVASLSTTPVEPDRRCGCFAWTFVALTASIAAGAAGPEYRGHGGREISR